MNQKQIIQYLQEDWSISNIDLSKKIGLAPSSCLLRVKNLKEQKVLKQFTVVVDEKILGYEITCFAKVAMSPLNRETSTTFIEEAKKIYISGCKEVYDSPNLIINNYLSHEYADLDIVSDRIKKIEKVTKEDIIRLANKVVIDTIFLLEGIDENEETSSL